MFRLLLLAALVVSQSVAYAQQSDGGVSVRVTVSQNADGSRTSYEFHDAAHTALATTTGKDGTLREKIRYVLDSAGHFQSGEIFGPGEKFRYKSLYKYDASGKTTEESHLTRDDVLINKLVFRYDAAGKQTGYSVLDANGKVIGQTTPIRK